MAIDYNDPGQVGVETIGGTNLDNNIARAASNMNAGSYNAAMNSIFNKKEANLNRTNNVAMRDTNQYYSNKILADTTNASALTGGSDTMINNAVMAQGLGKAEKAGMEVETTLSDYAGEVQGIQASFDEAVLNQEAQFHQQMMNLSAQYAQLTGYMYSPEVMYNYGMYQKTGKQEHLRWLEANGYGIDQNGQLTGGQATLARQQFEAQKAHNERMAGIASDANRIAEDAFQQKMGMINELAQIIYDLKDKGDYSWTGHGGQPGGQPGGPGGDYYTKNR